MILYHTNMKKHVVKKGFPFRGNIRETTWKPQVYKKCPWGFHPGNYLFPCDFLPGESPYAPVYMLPSHGNSGQQVVSPYGR